MNPEDSKTQSKLRDAFIQRRREQRDLEVQRRREQRDLEEQRRREQRDLEEQQEANRLAEQAANRKAKKAASDKKLRHLKNKGVTMSTPANATANAVAHPSTLQARQADLARNFPALEGNAASSSNVDPDAQRRRDMLEYQRLEAERARATSTATESKQCAGISLYSACPAGKRATI
jgi:hypothetical protein